MYRSDEKKVASVEITFQFGFLVSISFMLCICHMKDEFSNKQVDSFLVKLANNNYLEFL